MVVLLYRARTVRLSFLAADLVCLLSAGLAGAGDELRETRWVPHLSRQAPDDFAVPEPGEVAHGGIVFGAPIELPSNAVDSWKSRDFHVGPIINTGGYRMPAEFEYQRTLMVSCQAILYSGGIRQVIRAVSGRVTIVALNCDDQEYQTTCEMLIESGISPEVVRFASIPYNTMWTRDYGPISLSSKRGSEIAVLDTAYQEENRDDDELVPLVVAESGRLPVVSADLKIEGGNVISNGEDLVITTTSVFDDNPGMDEATVTEALREYYGVSQIVVLEPLQNEPTGHVDMFATFTSANCVVVGQYNPSDDRMNAEILERNAIRLASVRLPRGRLRVGRIPMPFNADGIWRTYTNVVYVNGVLLMPIYSGCGLDLQQQAVATFRELLPGWSVTLINADQLIASGGALHCVIMNLGPLSADHLDAVLAHRPGRDPGAPLVRRKF